MAGVAWAPKFRVTPENGSAIDYDLMALTWAGRPTKIEYDPQPDIERVEDINRVRRDRVWGCRPRVKITVQCGGNMADHATCVAILNAFMAGSIVECALDGVTYRSVVLRDSTQKPIADKWFAGVLVEVDVECAELLTELPAIGAGTW